MKKQMITMLLIGICMLAAGICYSCNRGIWKSTGGIQEVGLETVEEMVEETMIFMTDPPVSYFVHICGAVKNPGVYEVEEGSRIFQVVEMAGGFTQEAATEYLNMAQTIEDGMKIQVPAVDELEPYLLNGPKESAQAGQSGKVNLNTAGKEELMTLRGIGEAKAEDILRYREEHGPFQSIEEIMEISGIKDAAFQKIKEYITV